MTGWTLTLALSVAVVLAVVGAGGARAQSLVQQQPEDPCEGARALDIADTTPAAENLRRACRLERFEDRLAADRSQQVATQELTREARIQQWIDATQPWRVTRPLAFEAFFGTGLGELWPRLLLGLSPPRGAGGLARMAADLLSGCRGGHDLQLRTHGVWAARSVVFARS